MQELIAEWRKEAAREAADFSKAEALEAMALTPADVEGKSAGEVAEALKRAYRRQALRLHPDKYPDGPAPFLAMQASYKARDLLVLRVEMDLACCAGALACAAGAALWWLIPGLCVFIASNVPCQSSTCCSRSAECARCSSYDVHKQSVGGVVPAPFRVSYTATCTSRGQLICIFSTGPAPAAAMQASRKARGLVHEVVRRCPACCSETQSSLTRSAFRKLHYSTDKEPAHSLYSTSNATCPCRRRAFRTPSLAREPFTIQYNERCRPPVDLAT